VHSECDPPSITPQEDCTVNGATYTCSATGHPDPPVYTWTHWYWSPVTQQFPGTGTTYRIDPIGFHTLQCATTYSAPSYCPDYTAECSSNMTVRTFGKDIYTCFIFHYTVTGPLKLQLLITFSCFFHFFNKTRFCVFFYLIFDYFSVFCYLYTTENYRYCYFDKILSF